MKHLLISLFILILAVPCGAQWNYIDLGVPVTAFGVQDSFLFIASGSNSHVYRYTVARGYVYADTGLDFTQGTVTSFASLGRYFFAGMTLNGGPGAAYRSSDDGSLWVLNAGGYICSNGKYLFAVSDGIYQSKDSGNTNTWVKVTSFVATDLAAMGAYIFGANSNALWRSTDSGNHWSQLSPTFVGTMTVMDSLLFIVNGGNVIKSSDSGSHWNAVPVDSGGTVPEYVRVLATDGKNLFVGTPKGVFISTDHGSSWKPVDNTGLAGPNVIAMAVYDTLLAINVSYGLQTLYAVYTRPISQMTDTSPAGVVQQTPPGDSIEVYPNPATGIVTILAGGTSILGVSILNVLGEDVLDESTLRESDITLDLSELPSGTYFARILTEKGSMLKKIAINK